MGVAAGAFELNQICNGHIAEIAIRVHLSDSVVTFLFVTVTAKSLRQAKV